MENNYRVYRLDLANHIVEVEWVAAASDEEAVATTQAMTRAGKREIWHGARIVATVHVMAAEEPSSAFWL